MARIQLYDPFPETAFDDLIRTFLQPARSSRGQAAQQSFRIDVSENEKGFVVHAGLPGVTSAAEVKRETERREGERALHVERYAGSLFRSFTLPTEVDEAQSGAKFENGVLELTLAKKVAQAGRKLTIQ